MHLIKHIKNILKSIAVAFSIYSKIPMPRFKWDSDDMKYHFIFFPWVGLLIGMAQYMWMYLAKKFEISDSVFGIISVVLLIIITGGLHVDGFMDTCDALHSYQDRERKLEILKDPHIGAFSVICLAGLVLSYTAMAIQIIRWDNVRGWMCMCLVFAISRCLSALMVLNLKPAKSDGMMRSMLDNSSKGTVTAMLLLELVAVTSVMFTFSTMAASAVVLCLVIFTVWFKNMIYKQFGGLTGDLAGYYVCMAETLSITVITAAWLI